MDFKIRKKRPKFHKTVQYEKKQPLLHTLNRQQLINLVKRVRSAQTRNLNRFETFCKQMEARADNIDRQINQLQFRKR